MVATATGSLTAGSHDSSGGALEREQSNCGEALAPSPSSPERQLDPTPERSGRMMPVKTSPWPFDVPPSAAVITTSHVTLRRMPILYVTHDLDEDEGASWQFHCGNKNYPTIGATAGAAGGDSGA